MIPSVAPASAPRSARIAVLQGSVVRNSGLATLGPVRDGQVYVRRRHLAAARSSHDGEERRHASRVQTFPSAIARYARQKQRRDGEGGGSGGVGAGEGNRWSGGPYSAEDLEALPEVERQILVLSSLEGQSMRGVARRVGVPEMAAYKLYQQARQRLEGRVRSLEGGEVLALRRLVEPLHAAASPERRLPSRTWTMAAAGLKQLEYNQLIGRLEGAGAIEGRGQRQPGHLVDGGPATTLARLGIG